MKTRLYIPFVILNFVFTLTSYSVYGEKKETIHTILRGGTWKAKVENNNKVIEIGQSFTSKKYIEYAIFSKAGKFECEYDYYLSETPDETFKKDKVGKSQNGKYIISKLSSGEGITYVDEILEITPTFLKTKRIGGDKIIEMERKEKDNIKYKQYKSKKQFAAGLSSDNISEFIDSHPLTVYEANSEQFVVSTTIAVTNYINKKNKLHETITIY